MRIHIIGINYRPEQTGISVFTTGRAEHLAARGHGVTVCTAPPYYPEWRVASGYRGLWFSRERLGGVNVVRCPLYVPAVVTPLRRVLHEASFLVTSFLGSLFSRRPDVLLVVSPPLGLGIVAAVLSLLWRVPYVFDVQDLQPDAALDLGMLKPGRLTRFLYAIERLAYRRAARVSTITEAMRNRIVSKGMAPARVVIAPLWSAPELFELEPAAPGLDLRKRLRLGDCFLVLHAGNIGVKQGLDIVLEAARLSGDGNTQFVLLGDGAARQRLQDRARAMGLSNVQFVPLLERSDFLQLLATADVCLVTQQKSVADIVFPSKVLTLMAAAKPIIASVAAASTVASVIHASRSGVVIAPEDPASLHETVERLRRDQTLRARLAESGRAYAWRTWRRVDSLTRLEGILDEAVAHGL
jgi:colanic acid biosynthesis glycosyl transferase WcaI